MIRGHPRDAYRTFMAFAAFGTLLGGWAALVPQVQSDLGASKGALGLALLCIGLGSLPAMLLVGPVVDRRGPSVMPWALGALAVGAILPALAGSIWMLAAALVAVGAGSGAVDVSINAGASDIEARTGDRIMQLAHGLFSAGSPRRRNRDRPRPAGGRRTPRDLDGPRGHASGSGGAEPRSARTPPRR